MTDYYYYEEVAPECNVITHPHLRYAAYTNDMVAKSKKAKVPVSGLVFGIVPLLDLATWYLTTNDETYTAKTEADGQWGHVATVALASGVTKALAYAAQFASSSVR